MNICAMFKIVKLNIRPEYSVTTNLICFPHIFHTCSKKTGIMVMYLVGVRERLRPCVNTEKGNSDFKHKKVTCSLLTFHQNYIS